VRTTKLGLRESIDLLRDVEAKIGEVIKRGFEMINSERKQHDESTSPVSDAQI